MKKVPMANNILFMLHFNNISDGVSKNIESSPQKEISRTI